LDMKKPFIAIIVIVSFILLSGCAGVQTARSDEYEILGSGVSTCSFAMIGKYGDTMPSVITATEFLEVCKANTPDKYYAVIKKYPMEIRSKGRYYLLLVYDQDSKDIILFDYSCTPQPDGKVLTNRGKHDLLNLDLYDPCEDEKK
jgi:hypothetical protein